MAVDSGSQPLVSRRRSWTRRACAVGIGVLVAVLASELILRLALPTSETLSGELWWFREGGSDAAGQFTVDAEMGFRPRLGTSKYSEHGTLVNEYGC